MQRKRSKPVLASATARISASGAQTARGCNSSCSHWSTPSRRRAPRPSVCRAPAWCGNVFVCIILIFVVAKRYMCVYFRRKHHQPLHSLCSIQCYAKVRQESRTCSRENRPDQSPSDWNWTRRKARRLSCRATINKRTCWNSISRMNERTAEWT